MRPIHPEEPEQWLPIPGHPKYEASSLGRIRSVVRVVIGSDGRRIHLQSRVLKLQKHKQGYLTAVITDQRRRYAHTLVLETFVGPRPDGMECLHGPGGPADNRVSNLRWGTKRENAQDSLAAGTHPMARRTHCLRGHLLAAPNLGEASLARGIRSCVACNRGHSLVARTHRRSGVKLDLQEASDAYYAELMLAPGPSAARILCPTNGVVAQLSGDGELELSACLCPVCVAAVAS